MTASRRFRISVAVAVAVTALQVVWLLAEIGGPRVTVAFSDIVGIPVPLAAAWACWTAARRERGDARRAWIFLGAGTASWAVGEIVWTYYEVFAGVEVPFPSLADAGFLALNPLAVVALFAFPAAPRDRAARTRRMLDGTIVAVSMFALGWATVLGPVVRAGADSVTEQVIGLAYPFGDVVLIGVVLFVTARSTRAERVSMGLIAVGLAAIAVADGFFTYTAFNETFFTGSLIDVGWTVGFLLIGLGALRSGPTTSDHRERPPSRVTAILPYAGVAAGVPVAAVQFALHGTLDPVVFGVGIALFGVVSLRQLLVVMENATLAKRLDQKVKERTAELEGTLAQLAEASRLQDEFVSNATHELRTPLTIIIGALETLARPVDTIWQDAPMLIEMARKGAYRMNQLVDDLLLASGITDTFGSPRAPFDVAEHVHFALLSFEPTEKTVQTRMHRGMRAMGDAGRFQEALGHLLRNADKFGPEGSTISVEVTKDNGGVSVIVRDEGPGIPRHLRESVFERFYQADGSDTRRHGGMGLGLYLARGVVKMMGGDVTIDDVRRGCAVRITLPAAPASGVVDDDPQSRVRGAQSGLDALRRGA